MRTVAHKTQNQSERAKALARVRLSHSRAGGADEVVTLTRAELQQLVSDAVDAAFRAYFAFGSDPYPEYLSREGIAEALGITVAQFDCLRAQGLPATKIGGRGRPLFRLAACVEWIEANGGTANG